MVALLLLFPLFGSFLNGIVLRSRSVRRSGVLATFFSACAFAMAVRLFFELQRGAPLFFSIPWFSAGDLNLDWALRFDELTSVMVLMITGIGTLIHLYSIGYMSDEKTPYRYFAFLNLFLFYMLLLVCADNLPVLFVGWEGVGLCSYLLIGYYYDDLKNCKAGSKAFIVNRIGDAGFLIGMFLCHSLFHSLSFSEMASALGQANRIDLTALNLAAFFLFVGATGKSAQIPLFVWLPDAMAGPTPVSALIHAATMVTAGIYLIIRMNFLFVVAPITNQIIATIGISTALLAAFIATSQNDIKKVLAYSTVSQLGLMFVGLGAGAYVASLFHVVTHAFFKALLFLGAGSVIHGLSGKQNILEMGGLRKHLPVTFVTFLIAVLAISGVPPLSGFFSKDLLLFSTLSLKNGPIVWALGLLVSLLTAFYMARLFVLVFLGRFRGSHDIHAHESPIIMLIPLIILAVGSAIAGFLEFPEDWHLLPSYLSHYLSNVVPPFPVNPHETLFVSETTAMAIATMVGATGLAAGFWFYSNPEREARIFSGFRIVFSNQFWVDELYELLFARTFRGVSKFFARVFDSYVIDGAVLVTGHVCRLGGTLLSVFQSGNAQFYLFVMVLGAFVILFYSLRGGLF